MRRPGSFGRRHWLLRAPSALALVFLLVGCGGDGRIAGPSDPPPPPVPCLTSSSLCHELVPVGGGFRLPVFRTHSVQAGDSSVVRAVIVIHGADRNPDAYFERMVEAVRLSNLTRTTLVIAPHFQISADGPGANEPFWTEGGWKRGDESSPHSGTGQKISSYGAVDELLSYVGDPRLFPMLETVVVTGHSAGGQYAHRFAATSPGEGALPHLRFRYVVANPSTYLYLGPERITEGGGWGVPNRETCPTYDRWHYGPDNRNSYALRLSEEALRALLVERDVVYMVGSNDTGDDALDMSCGAMLQGRHRYARGLNFFEFMNVFFPESDHPLVVVPDVGHSSTRMYQSSEGRQVLFLW